MPGACFSAGLVYRAWVASDDQLYGGCLFPTHCGWAQHVSGERLHFSSMLAVDESYRLLRMLGLVGEHGKKEKDDSSPCDGASPWSALLQTGHSNLACKTGVSYQVHRAVNVAAVGNLHLGPLMAMLRGEILISRSSIPWTLLDLQCPTRGSTCPSARCATATWQRWAPCLGTPVA